MSNAVFTIAAKNYLPFVRVLMASLRKWAPELKRIVILVDKPDGYFDPAAEDFEIILSEDLEIPQSRWFHFKYTILELSTAVKPYAASFIFERYAVGSLLYFDPDIQVYSDLNRILESVEQHNILLTPHLTAPIADDRHPSDLDILRSGAYNLGFVGMKKSEETARFLEWWEKRLYDDCVVDLPKGLFVDQRWVDLVPGLFAGVAILRDPGLNVAYWNLAQRPVVRGSDGFEVNGSRLCFFHFSGFDPEHPHNFSRHQNRLTLDDLAGARDVVLDYRQRLFEQGYSQCKNWPYAYGFFANGFPIPDMGRPAHHEAPEILERIRDPFSEDGYRAFVDMWNQPVPGAGPAATGVTRLAYRIYRSRADVQEAMPNIFGEDLLRFLKWMISSGRPEHNLSEVFVAPIRGPIQSHEKVSDRSATQHEPVPDDPLFNEKITSALQRRGIGLDRGSVPVEALNQLTGNGDARLHLSQLASAIYESRPDLQRSFPDPCGRDGLGFLTWFLNYGAVEYGLTDDLTSPLRAQWKSLLGSVQNPLVRMRHRSLFAAMAGSVALRRHLGTFGPSVHRMATLKLAARNGHHPPTLASRPIGERPSITSEIAGVNLIGYAASEMGVGESVRCAARAAHAAGLDVGVRSVDESGPYRRRDRSLSGHSRECSHPVNIFHVNADQSDRVIARLDESVVQDRYNIGFWAWELEQFPSKWSPAFRLFHEIWTPSGFCQTSIGRVSPIPVVRMPHAIALDACEAAGRSDFAVPDGPLLFLAFCDLLSVLERKNPLGVVSAFRHAFEGSPECHLVLKVNHAEQKPVEMARIRAAVRGLPVTIVDRTIDRSQVTGLIQMADCLVSLHRSEGFGLTIAEAMYLSKPVIATAYSGNMDFTTPDNAFLVDYDLAPVPGGCDPYEEGALWADPRSESAVEQMRLVANRPDLREERALRGRERIREQYSPHAVGRLMRERLEMIAGLSGAQVLAKGATAAR